jgi:hypothetical protein
MMYRDFVYVRPPLSPYLHSIELLVLPDTWQLLGMRLVYYLMMAAATYWTVSALDKVLDLQKHGIPKWTIACLGFIFSVGNNMAGPWHTVDGIFFSALGAFLITRSARPWNLGAGLFALGLAAMCKQPFALVPLAALPFLFAQHGWARSLKAIGIAIGLAAIGAILIEVVLSPDYSFFQGMLAQSTGSTKVSDLKWAGILLYVRPTLLVFAFGIGIWLVFQKLLKLKWAGAIAGAYAFLGIFSVALGMAYFSYKFGGFIKPSFGFYHALNGLALILCGVLVMRAQSRRAGLLLALMQATSWAAGISWGFPYPVYYNTPAIICIGYALVQLFQWPFPKLYWPGLLALSLACMLFLNRYVYADGISSSLNKNLGEIFPKLSHIQSSEETYLKFSELKAMIAKHGDRFTVLPGFSFANYISDTPALATVDLAHDAELGKGLPQMIQTMDTQLDYVLADKAELSHADAEGNYRCSSLKHVLEHWQPVDSSQHFIVYVKQP